MGFTRVVAMVVVFVGLVAGGCGGGSGDDDDDGPSSCTTDADCSGATPACDVAAMLCVQCTDVNTAACGGATPNCAGDHTCQGACNSDAGCASGVCLGDGVCADPDTVLYAGKDLTGATCTRDDKCSFETAVGLAAAPRDIIHLDPGPYRLAAGVVLDGKSLHIAGRDAAFLVPTGTALSVLGGGTVTIDGLTIGGEPGMIPDYAVDCLNATLTLRVTQIQFAAFHGIVGSGCTLAVQRSSLHDNAGGAMQLGGGGVFALTNNYIFRNGNIADASAGGIQILGSVPAGSSIEFNTIVDNVCSLGATNSGGIICNTAGFTAPNNLIARNAVRGDTAAVNAQTRGACTFPTSIVQADVANLAFASPDTAPYSYAIGAGSMAIDLATTSSAIAVDHQGDARPQGANKDVGADEHVP